MEKVLGQADQGVVHGGVAVGMVLAQHVAHAGGGLLKGLVRGQVVLVHGVEDPPVHRLQAVPHVGQSPAHDDGHGIVDVAVLHLLDQLGLHDVLVGEGDVLRAIVFVFCHSFTPLSPPPGGGTRNFQGKGPPERRGSSCCHRWSRLDRRRLAPARWFPARPRAGRLSLEESRRKNTRGKPLDPGGYGRSFPLAGFGVSYLWNGRGAIPSGVLRPIWDAFSRRNMLKSIFVKESFQIRGYTWAP